MVNIKKFKYVDTNSFDIFLKGYGYKLDDVKGFNIAYRKQYHGNVLKIYNIHFNDDEYEYFNVVLFKSYIEYKKTALGFNGERLLDWYQDANIRKYK